MVDHDHTANPADIPLDERVDLDPLGFWSFALPIETRDSSPKLCPKCKISKPENDFHKNRSHYSGISRECKTCANKRITEHYQRLPGARVAASARWRQANPGKSRAKSQRRRATKRALPSQWTDADAQRMLAYWKNCCAICSQHVEPNNAFYYLAQDHWIPITSPECPGTVPWNMLPLCHSKIGHALGCNNAKSNADPIAWLNRLYPDDPKLVAKILARIAKYFKTVKA